MSDPLDKISAGAQKEAASSSDQPDPLSHKEVQAADKNKAKALTAGIRADQSEDRHRQTLCDRITALESALSKKDHLPAEVARLQQCVDAFRAIGWAHIVGTSVGTLSVGASGLFDSEFWKWLFFVAGTISLGLTEMYRYVAQIWGLPSKVAKE